MEVGNKLLPPAPSPANTSRRFGPSGLAPGLWREGNKPLPLSPSLWYGKDQ
jgi:hypothetical protein